MATLLQPDIVVRLDPDDAWNHINNMGFKWHLGKIDPKDGLIHKTCCGIVVEKRTKQVSEFEAVKAKDLCASCFSGFKAVD